MKIGDFTKAERVCPCDITADLRTWTCGEAKAKRGGGTPWARREGINSAPCGR
ncbi:hypothetical protein PCYB_133800 [Plasmodium cynomolgi strain B]|uniref:Uncharacterized protein n=1 Tax=Plasmodium cynomolgi (strain B) TaxID=1120755 RepID=K6UEK4_PLACD|nr:hypothetical protein PCYB_133800 [Plasmodium cynomolgi strain B]GAB68506.1 hypothetical protein PCYB_133800 [Plasmodium cynomolgi strain B]